MAVLLAVENFESRDGSIDQNYRRTYNRTFRVACDDPRDGPVTILRASVVPRVGDIYSVSPTEFDTQSFVQSLDFRFLSLTPYGADWQVNVRYGPYDTQTLTANPVEWPVRFSWGAAKYEIPVARDVDGKPIVNSAGEPFAEPTTIDGSRRLLTFTRNELVSAFDPMLAARCADKVNLYPWNGFAPKTVKSEPITTGEAQYSQDVGWWFTVQYSFAVDPDGWIKRPLDQGYTYLSAVDPTKRFTVRSQGDGQKLDDPALLDGSGYPLAPGADPVFLAFEVYEAIDFSIFNLDLATALGMY